MMGQQFFTLLIAIVCITFVHGATKQTKKVKKPTKLNRQGLEVSLESHEANPPGELLQEPAHQNPMVNGGNQKLESAVHNNDYDAQYRNQDPDNVDYQNQDQNQDYYDGNNLAHINQMEQQFEDDDEDGFFLDMESGEYDSKEMIMLHGKGTRALEAGDVFTAQEMLPIAEKLMNRANSNGKGKGIVTSETNPKSLADNLFEKYFWTNCEIHLLNGETVVSQAEDWCNLVETTDENKVFKMKRIVMLKDEDISGLDALQALALSGTVNTQRSREKFIDSWGTNLKKRGNEAIPDSKKIASKRKSRYRLLTKPFYNKIRRVPRRRENYPTDGRKAQMAKNRKLVVNPKRRRLAKKIINRKGRGGQLKKTKVNKIGRQGQNPSKKKGTPNKMDGGSTSKRFCRWKYGCDHQLVLETCKLSIDCSEDAKSKEYLGIKLAPHEKRENLAMLRTWAGVDVIDAEVEKILENRYHQLISSKLGNIQRSESVADYFNNLINFQKHEYVQNINYDDGVGPTTPMQYEESGNPDAQGDPGAQDAQGDPGAQDSQGDPGAQDGQGDTGAQDAQGDPDAQDAQEDPDAPSNRLSGEDAYEDPSAPSYGLSDEDAQGDPGASNGLSGEGPEPVVVQLNAELVDPAEGQEVAEEVADPEAVTVAEEGTMEPEHIQEEVEIAATELADTENRRKFLSDHKTTKKA